MSRKKLVLFSVITILAILSCLELSARVVLSFKKHSWRYMFYGIKGSDQDKNVRMVRGQKFRWVTGHNGEKLYYKAPSSNDPINPVNSLGFRGQELQTKTNDVIRVVCLGGSTTYGADLNYKDTYPQLLQDELDRKCGAGRYEVVNGGQPGFNLSHIVAQVQWEIIALRPEILIVMSINNNLKAPGFWFVQLQDGQRERYAYVKQVRKFLVNHLALANLITTTIKGNAGNWLGEYFKNFDWEGFGRALMVEDNIWEEEFRTNARRIIEIFSASNPRGTILFLEQAVNTLRFPAMEQPFDAAKRILQNMSSVHDNVYTLDIHSTIIAAAREGEQVWLSPAFDPLHLSRKGNELLADCIVNSSPFFPCSEATAH